MEPTQCGHRQQSDRTRTDDHGALAVALPVEGGVQSHRGGLGEHCPLGGHLPDREALGLVGDDHLGPAPSGDQSETQRRRSAPTDPWLVESLADIGHTRRTVAAHRVKPPLGTADDHVDCHPVALLHPCDAGAGLLDDGHELVAGDLLRLCVVGTEHHRELGVGEADVRPADRRELRT